MIPGMKTRQVEPDIDVVELTGTLGLGSTLSWIESDLRRRIREGSRKLILDVTQLRYTDSAGLGMIITINGEIEQAGGRLRIAGANGMVAKSFSISHIDRVLQMDADVDAACKEFGGSG
jgi:anti-anti-sigma factor